MLNNRKNSIRARSRYQGDVKQTYAVIYCKEVNRDVMLHKLIKHAPKGYIIDHFDRNGLNDLESNLKIVTQSQNMLNKGLQNNNRLGVKNIRQEGKYYCINLSKKYESLKEAVDVRNKIYAVIYENDYPELLNKEMII
ncbi:HNH endonuclease [Anaerocolumna aminovalerica]|uniref:HNH endonuclease n=1 Tax=Anaerocolumna aminovalerica TaxID=1527 RepID=UPI001C0EF493|nr:HNH endonuclease [Anaerocolumna aminovalerica]MBU5331756.1 HNH endonuclease [Anaerocolumna aminovalerica]